jgi:hypothetical protein
MKFRIFSSFALYLLGVVAVANAAPVLCPPQTVWDRTYGGSRNDYLFKVQLVPNGTVAVGYTESSDGQVSNPLGATDAWVAMLDQGGGLVWERTLGGDSIDYGVSVAVVPSGGLIVGAISRSGASGNKTSQPFGSQDYWVIRLNAKGVPLWDKSFGGTFADDLLAVVPTSDGGFFLAGTSVSPVSGNKTSPNWDSGINRSDYWVVRIDAHGEKLWDRTYGGTNVDYLATAVLAPDDGLILGGTSASPPSGNKTADLLGERDYWILKINSGGDIVWQRSYGGVEWEEFETIAPTADGGYLIGGRSYSPENSGNKTSPQYGEGDFWVVRIEGNGDIRWDRSYGGSQAENLMAVETTPDGGFILAGSTMSLPGETKTSPWLGSIDAWVVRVDTNGRPLWENSYGALHQDVFNSVRVRPDGGYLFAGSSNSGRREAKLSPRIGENDFWIVQVSKETPGDCDGDAVPDANDRCAGTALGDIVNGEGCGLEQQCPCGQAWTTRDDYVLCVDTNTATLVTAGLMTEARRQIVLSAARIAQCPPVPYSTIVYGLTNSVIGYATLETPGGVTGQLNLTDLGPNGSDGVSLHLGQAESGVFISPYADIWGNFDERWALTGRAYGRVNGQNNLEISRLTARKPYYETYPVDVDLSGLGATNVTWMIWSNEVLVAVAQVDSPVGTVTFHTADHVGPRGNPFWRLPDGSVGALIELTTPSFENTVISGPFGDDLNGNRVFVRANAPVRSAEYVSRVDLTVAGGLTSLSVVDERLGIFGRPHRALGTAVMLATIDRLQIDNLQTSNDQAGVFTELRPDLRFNYSFEPVLLTNTSAALTLLLNGHSRYAPNYLGTLEILRETNGISVTPHFGSEIEHVEMRAYHRGVLQGTAFTTNHSSAGHWELPALSSPTGIIAAGAGLVATGSVALFAFTLDGAVRFRDVQARSSSGITLNSPAPTFIPSLIWIQSASFPK